MIDPRVSQHFVPLAVAVAAAGASASRYLGVLDPQRE